MLKPAEATWRKGFAAGQHIGSPCPYCTGSTNAEIWADGWNQGRRKRDGYSYRDRPLTSFLDDSGGQQASTPGDPERLQYEPLNGFNGPMR